MPRHHTLLLQSRSGFTLTEIMISITLMLILMLAVARTFQYVGNTVTESRAELDASKKLRAVQTLLERDLAGVTVPMKPPRKFADNEGYFCYIEGRGGYYGNNQGPLNRGWSVSAIALDSDSGGSDNTVSDMDDILMFTARAKSDSEKFRGLVNGIMRESHEAEICWFVRGTTLYRRVLLIVPDTDLNNSRVATGFFNDNDVSIHLDSSGNVTANTLADLGRRENRFGHWNQVNPSLSVPSFSFPYALHYDPAWYWLRLPTMVDCTRWRQDSGSDLFYWQAGRQIYSGSVMQPFFQVNGVSCNNLPDGNAPFIDYWFNPYPWNNPFGALTSVPLAQTSGSLIAHPGTGETGGMIIESIIRSNPSTPELMNLKPYIQNLFASRDSSVLSNPNQRSEDVVLSNVIGFNVQAWDPDQDPPSYIDLYSNTGGTELSGQGNQPNLPGAYDTWTDWYELQEGGVDGNGREGIAVNGIVNNSSEDYMKHLDQWEYPPPYTVPLRGIQIKIRIFDPSTHLPKEVTIKADFRTE